MAPPHDPSRLRSVTRALLVLNVLWCTLALAQEGLPGWRMFEAVDDVTHELRDRDGRAVDIRAWLPRTANLTDRGELRRIVRFVCERERARAPFTYDEPPTGLHATLGPADCKVHASH